MREKSISSAHQSTQPDTGKRLLVPPVQGKRILMPRAETSVQNPYNFSLSDHDKKPVRQMITDKELSVILGVSVHLLRKWRCRSEGPPYAKYGNSVRYYLPAVEEWVASTAIYPGRGQPC